MVSGYCFASKNIQRAKVEQNISENEMSLQIHFEGSLLHDNATHDHTMTYQGSAHRDRQVLIHNRLGVRQGEVYRQSHVYNANGM